LLVASVLGEDKERQKINPSSTIVR